MLCDDLEGRDGGGREGICVYLWLIHAVVQQKLTQVVKELYPNKMGNQKALSSTAGGKREPGFCSPVFRRKGV